MNCLQGKKGNLPFSNQNVAWLFKRLKEQEQDLRSRYAETVAINQTNIQNIDRQPHYTVKLPQSLGLTLSFYAAIMGLVRL